MSRGWRKRHVIRPSPDRGTVEGAGEQGRGAGECRKRKWVNGKQLKAERRGVTGREPYTAPTPRPGITQKLSKAGVSCHAWPEGWDATMAASPRSPYRVSYKLS